MKQFMGRGSLEPAFSLHSLMCEQSLQPTAFYWSRTGSVVTDPKTSL